MSSLFMGLTAAAIVASLALGGWFGVQWQEGRDAIALKAAHAELERLTADMNTVALTHANVNAALSTQLGNTRVQLRTLSTGRDCMSADAVRLLNDAFAGVPTAPAKPASAPAAAATDRDLGDALAICRGEYRKLSEQMNAILDIEESKDLRH